MPDKPHLDVASDEVIEPKGCFAWIQSLGLAAYALLLLAIAISAMLCAMGSMQGLIENAISPHELVGGVVIETWRVEELRRREIIPPDGLPDLYHDHSRLGDGSSGCLVIEGEVVRFELWTEEARVPIHGATVTAYGDIESPTVTTTLGELTVNCPFEDGEGGERFARMLQAESAMDRE